MMYQPSGDKNKTILDLSRINEYEKMALPEPDAVTMVN
jgi:hypothetical protein